jgi:hypothetical protein
VTRRKLELLARWSRIVGDSGTLGLTDESSDEVSGGIAWYLKGHTAKFIFDVMHLNGSTVTDNRLNVVAGDVGWLYRTQFQLDF